MPETPKSSRGRTIRTRVVASQPYHWGWAAIYLLWQHIEPRSHRRHMAHIERGLFGELDRKARAAASKALAIQELAHQARAVGATPDEIDQASNRARVEPHTTVEAALRDLIRRKAAGP